jgi:N-acetylmuramic acid 6-phosphate etherase
MKAGTAQRIALNLLSSLLMILLGRVYEGLMVDVQAVNAKLVRRSENMLMHLSHHSRDHVRDALARAGGSVKLAFLLLQGCTLEEAETMLDRAGGQMRVAMTLLGKAVPDAPELKDIAELGENAAAETADGAGQQDAAASGRSRDPRG